MKTIKIYKKALSRKVKNVNKRTKITASSSNENIIKFQNIVTLYIFLFWTKMYDLYNIECLDTLIHLLLIFSASQVITSWFTLKI